MIAQLEIEEKLLLFISKEIFKDQKQLTIDTDLVAAGFDSMSLVALLLFMEREFKVWMPEQGMTSEVLSNIKSLAAHILKQIK